MICFALRENAYLKVRAKDGTKKFQTDNFNLSDQYCSGASKKVEEELDQQNCCCKKILVKHKSLLNNLVSLNKRFPIAEAGKNTKLVVESRMCLENKARCYILPVVKI